jgi:hypothetical protein
MEALTQEIEQRDARIVEDEVAPRTVHGEADGVSHAGLRSEMVMGHRKRATAVAAIDLARLEDGSSR